MSREVRYKGKLKKLKGFDNETLENQCMRIILHKGLELDDFYDSYQEMLLDEYYQEYVVYENELYRMEFNEIDSSDVFIAHKNSDETIDFDVMYYNGGCGLSEAIAYALENLE